MKLLWFCSDKNGIVTEVACTNTQTTPIASLPPQMLLVPVLKCLKWRGNQQFVREKSSCRTGPYRRAARKYLEGCVSPRKPSCAWAVPACSGHAAPHPESCRRHQSLQTEACCWLSLLLKAIRFHFRLAGSGTQRNFPGSDASQESSRDRKHGKIPAAGHITAKKLPARCASLHRYLGPEVMHGAGLGQGSLPGPGLKGTWQSSPNAVPGLWMSHCLALQPHCWEQKEGGEPAQPSVHERPL